METKNENVGMKPSGNRVVDGLVQWMAEQKRDEGLFKGDKYGTKHFAAVKYKYYKDLVIKYSATANPEEKRYLDKVKGEMQDLKMIAHPKKFERRVFNTIEFMVDGVRLLGKVGGQIGKLIQAFQERRKENVLQNLPVDIKDPKVLATKRHFDEAVKPVVENRYQKTVGPDRDLRRNNPDAERGHDEKVRFKIEDDVSLMPKKGSKNKVGVSSADGLLPKNRESSGKGLKV